jgi:hypothetical protein
MNQAVPPSVAALLVEWARHECLGRYAFGPDADADPKLRDYLADAARRGAMEADTDAGRQIALDVFLQKRHPLLVPLLAAEPIGVEKVRISREAIARVGYLEHANFAGTELDDFARQLAEGPAPLVGGTIGVSSDPAGRIQLIDGLHRARAWIERWRLGSTTDPLPVSVIVTARRSRWEEPT